MIHIPEEVKNLYRRNNISDPTVKTARLRFFDGEIDLLYPGEDVWPSDDLFPVDDTPMLLVDGDRISSETFVLEQALCDSNALKFGQCSSAMMEIVVSDVTLDVTGKEFALSVEVGDYEMMLGIYKVDSFVRQVDGSKRKITAFDRMRKFDIDVADWYNSLTFPLTLKQFRDSLCEFVGIKQKDVTLPLDDMQVAKTIDPSQISGRDIMKAICEINGCFGQIDVAGKFKYVFLGASGLYPSEELHPADDLFPSELEGETLSYYNPSGTTYEDFLVYGIDQVQIRQEEGDVGAVYGGGKNAYTIQGNFLVYGKSASELMNIAATAYDQISGKIYRPCKIVTAALPWVEPGDGIICYTSDDVIETYCLKRTLKGIQAMTDTYEAQGTKERKQNFGIPMQIIQLEGKTAVIKKSVEEVSVRVSDLKEETETKFIQTAKQILAEVTRAQQAEASLRIRADQIAMSVTSLANETNSKFEQTAEQISLKVSKGDVSSQLSIEPDDIILKTNRLSWESNYSSMTKDGVLTCRNIRAINGTFSGNLESETFYANDDAVGFGDYYVSVDGTNLLRSKNGWVQINTNDRPSGSPGGRMASLFIGGDGYTGVTITGTGRVNCGDVKCGDILFKDSWSAGYTALDMFKQIYNRLSQLRNFVDMGSWDD
ncbi:tail fiber domain-containing protein [Lacrimispora sp. JR3]|uniref:tail fiber domain-containing protein n=1 Tax=Lacrimispora sinapis TaxID=3111456 RepID=UPI003749C207